jgi:hypothetical protein
VQLSHETSWLEKMGDAEGARDAGESEVKMKVNDEKRKIAGSCPSEMVRAKGAYGQRRLAGERFLKSARDELGDLLWREEQGANNPLALEFFPSLLCRDRVSRMGEQAVCSLDVGGNPTERQMYEQAATCRDQ